MKKASDSGMKSEMTCYYSFFEFGSLFFLALILLLAAANAASLGFSCSRLPPVPNTEHNSFLFPLQSIAFPQYGDHGHLASLCLPSSSFTDAEASSGSDDLERSGCTEIPGGQDPPSPS